MTATVERLSIETVAVKTKPAIEESLDHDSGLLNTFNSLLPVFTALASILAIRLYLLLAVTGAFTLALTSLPDTSYHGMWTLVSYCVFTVLPLVWLDSRPKKG